jgi:trigger factor
VPQGVRVQVPPSPYIPALVIESWVYEKENDLNIEQQLLENHQVRLTVEVENTKLEEAKHRAARHISQHKKIPGFRPGKAPYAIVLRNFGEETILEEALDIVVKDIYPKLIEESKIKPYGPGSLENMSKLDPPTFVFIVPLEPEIILGNYKDIRIPYKLKSITKKDINKVLEDLRERQVVLEPTDLPAKVGDQVYIKLSINRLHPTGDEIPSLVNDRRIPVVISSDSGDKKEWPFPGFSQYLIGVRSAEEKVFQYTYPKDSEYKELRNIETEVHLFVEEIKKRFRPDLTDEFAQSVGEQYENLTSLTDNIRNSLEKQAKEDYDNEYNDKIMVVLLKSTAIKYPPQMLEREIDIFIDQLENRLAQQKLDMETYLKMRKIDTDALRTEINPQAEERLKRSLVLLEIAKLENIHVENNELESESMRTLDELGRIMPAEKARKTLTNEFIRGMIGNIGADLLIRHTWDFLHEVARGEKETEAVVSDSVDPTQGLDQEKTTEKNNKKKNNQEGKK